MPQDRPVPGTAEDWLARAEGDLALARAPLPEGAFYQDLCFHAEQAAEKAIKAIYQHYNKRFRYTHDLDELITLIRISGATKVNIGADSKYKNLPEPSKEKLLALIEELKKFTVIDQKKNLTRLLK